MNRNRPSPAFRLGTALMLLLIAAALLSLVWTPHDPVEMRILARLRPPSAQHWLGTDQFGRDIASMLLVGARNTLLIGLVAVGIGLAAGVALGLLAASHHGGLADEALMRAMDFTFAFPAVLSAILILTHFGPGVVNAMVAIGIFNIPVFARQARGAALQILAQDYIRAARLAGLGPAAIMARHVLPNMAGLLLVQGSTQFAFAILAEASLSYLGIGTQPPNPSWGRMLNDAQTYLSTAPHLALMPGLAIALAVLAFNLLGDGLRDRFDPRLRER